MWSVPRGGAWLQQCHIVHVGTKDWGNWNCNTGHCRTGQWRTGPCRIGNWRSGHCRTDLAVRTKKRAVSSTYAPLSLPKYRVSRYLTGDVSELCTVYISGISSGHDIRPHERRRANSDSACAYKTVQKRATWLTTQELSLVMCNFCTRWATLLEFTQIDSLRPRDDSSDYDAHTTHSADIVNSIFVTTTSSRSSRRRERPGVFREIATRVRVSVMLASVSPVPTDWLNCEL